MKLTRHIAVTLLSIISFAAAAQQTTKIRGIVTDAVTGEPMAFVSMTVPGTTVGTTTDFDGLYTIETREEVSELSALFISYEPQTKPVNPGAFNSIDFALQPVTTDIDEIVVKPGEDPAYEVLRNVYRNKFRNDPDQKETYAYNTYTKMELDIVNMKNEFRNKRMQRNFGFVYEYMDTSAITGKAYLPAMITESTGEFYYQKSPKTTREVMNASRISGIEQDFNLAQFTGGLHVNVNLYNNYINIFDVNFASPLSDHGSMFYKFYLVDSVKLDQRKIYKIRFHPRNRSTPVFDGEVNIDSMTWALESAFIRIPKGLNLNWIRDLVIQTKNQRVNDSTWFPLQDRMIADMSVTMKDSSKLVSFMVQRQIDYSDIRINEPIPPEILAQTGNIIMNPRQVMHNEEEYWKEARPYELSQREINIYGMVDSIKKAPLFKNIYTTISTVMFGYYRSDKLPELEFGPYYRLFSYNKMEGSRFSAGLRTTSSFSRKIRLSGYGAYGLRDERLKGGGSIEIMFKRVPYTSKLTLSARRDVLQLGSSRNGLSTGNILGTVLSRGNNERLTMVNQFDLEYEREWWEGFSNTFSFGYSTMFPTRFVEFRRPDGSNYGNIKAPELRIGTRISKDDEVVMRGSFSKSQSGSKYPVIGISLAASMEDFMGSRDQYLRAELSSRYSFSLAPLGRSTVVVSGGKIFGTVPFPLLKLHEGNATYYYDPMAYSCMDFYEFASDIWGSVFWEHHFRGFFLGKIPLLERLQWREVVTAKFLWGQLSDKNNGSLPDTRAKLLFPEGMRSVSKPYVEVGVGIENIFRLLRIDAVWRLTHRDDYMGRKIDTFAINMSLHLSF